MANFDPAQRVETWLFQQIGVDLQGKPVFKRLPYNLVSYDGSPDRVLEPTNAEERVDVITGCTVLVPRTHVGQVGGMEYLKRHFDAFALDDYNAAGAPSV